MKSGKIKLAMVLIFLSGMVIGAVGGLVAVRAAHQKWVRSQPEHKVQLVVKRLGRRLELRDEQLPEIRKSVNKGLFKMGLLQLSSGKQFLKILEDTIDDMEPALDADQQEKLNAMMQALRDHLSRKYPAAANMIQQAGGQE